MLTTECFGVLKFRGFSAQGKSALVFSGFPEHTTDDEVGQWLQKMLGAAAGAAKSSHFIIDLGESSFTRDGLGDCLLGLTQRVGSVTLISTNPDVQRLLEISRSDRFIRIASSAAEALSSLGLGEDNEDKKLSGSLTRVLRQAMAPRTSSLFAARDRAPEAEPAPAVLTFSESFPQSGVVYCKVDSSDHSIPNRSTAHEIFKARIERMTEQCQRLVLDLNAISLLGDEAIGTLISARKRLVEKGGQLCLVSAQPKVVESLTMKRLHSLLGLQPSAESAATFLGIELSSGQAGETTA